MRGKPNYLRSGTKLLPLILLVTLAACASPVAVKCPSLPPAPKALTEPAKNEWLLLPASPTASSSKTVPMTPEKSDSAGSGLKKSGFPWGIEFPR